MLYGDVFELLRDGIRSDPNALQPVGIFGNSQCWAVWLHDASKDKPDPAPHLVISPLHPRFWPFLLRFELKLAERVGAMAEAAEFLAVSGLNIHFGESSPSGHHHATWNVVCEAVNVRRRFEGRIQAFRREKEPLAHRDDLNRLANELAEAMYQTAVDVRDRMESCTFLHERIRDPQMWLLHQPRHLALEGTAKQLAIDDFPTAVRVRWIQNLPVFAFYGSKIGEPHRLEFDPETSMLRSASGEPFVEVLKEGGVETLPTNAIASIYPEEHHVRVIPIRSAREMDGLLQIDVEYEARFDSAVTADAPATDDTSIHIWARVCSHIQDYKIDLRRVTNTTTRRALDNECGVLSLIGVREGELSDKQMQQLAMRIEDLQESPARGKGGRHLVLFPTLSPRAIRKVFISWRREVPYGVRLRQYAEESARKWGLDPIFVDSPTGDELSDVVISRLAQCDAFFQILSLTGSEVTGYLKEQSPALGWMLFEFGLAKGRGIPFVRTVDTTTVLKVSDWSKILRVGSDLLGEFQLGDEAKQIDDLMRRLAHKVRERAGTHR